MIPDTCFMRKNLIYLLSLCLPAALASSAWAGDFVVGVESNDYLPLYKGDANSYSGFAREVLDAFATRYGHTFRYRTMPVARLYHEFLVQQSLDFKFPDNPMWNPSLREHIPVSYSNGLVMVTDGLLVPPAKKGSGLVNIHRIATVRGFSPHPYADQIREKKITLFEVNTPDAAMNMAAAGRVDAAFLGTIAARYIMNEVIKQPGVLVFDDSLPYSRGEFSLATLAHPKVIKQMNDFLGKEKELVVKLKAKYKITE